MKKLIILLIALASGTVHTNYSLEAISGPYNFEAISVLLEMGNGSLGIYGNPPKIFSGPASDTNIITTAIKEAGRPPFLGKSYIGFKEALAFQESRGDYFVKNAFGYLGKYQFGEGTLEVLGVSDGEAFINDPRLQEAVFYANLGRNKWILRREIKRYTGKVLQTITITESGILAAAHLSGPGNVKKYLRSGGAHDVADAYGTHISDYLKKFAGYDISIVIPLSNEQRSSNGAYVFTGTQTKAEKDVTFSDQQKAHP